MIISITLDPVELNICKQLEDYGEPLGRREGDILYFDVYDEDARSDIELCKATLHQVIRDLPRTVHKTAETLRYLDRHPEWNGP